MKKLSPKQKLYWLRRQRKLNRKRCKKTLHKAKNRFLHGKCIQIKAPVCFQLSPKKQRHKTLVFFDTLRKSVTYNHRIKIDFRDTEQIFADAAVLLRAEIERILKYLPKSRMTCILPESQQVKQVLFQIDVLKLLQYNKKIPITREDVIHWKHAHGNLVDGTKYNDVLGQYDGNMAESLTRGLYQSITEAMGNSCEHAYIKRRDDAMSIIDTSNDWWIFSQQKDGMLSVAFCDLGAGIPRTISKTRKDMWEKIKRAFAENNDADIIHFATGSGKSRTEKPYRGKGLPQLVSGITHVKGGKLRIFSNKGVVTYQPDNKPMKESFKDSICGTVIIWEIPTTKG